MIKRIVWLTIFMSANLIYAQQLKHEFRAVWVATVNNIDWPSSRNLSTQEQKQEIIHILDFHKSHHANAIILQVRPTADAIYPSAYEPWTKSLCGKQGKAPNPFYDPLEYWITETHKRGMELHAWFNPYRIKQNLDDSLVADHIIKQHPDWGWEYGNRLYFEPGNPDVWHFITQVVTDVVKRYDIDAVHFDDYFYPYKIDDQLFPDSATFKKFGGRYYPNQINNWRRHNTDTIIQLLSTAIKKTKPWVKFGISPFGVWQNRSENSHGSETSAGLTNYRDLYADVIKWQSNGWIDYLMPQLYWRDNHPDVGFSTLAYWWNDFSYGHCMYIGLAPYRINKKSKYKYWRKEKYFIKQITLTRKLQNIQGFGYFSSNSLMDKNRKLNKLLSKKTCAYPTIVPAMPWIDNEAPDAPYNISKANNRISWVIDKKDNEFDKARFFVVYQFKLNSTQQLKKAENMMNITGQNYVQFDTKIPKGIYRISALDRLNNESQLSEPIIITK